MRARRVFGFTLLVSAALLCSVACQKKALKTKTIERGSYVGKWRRAWAITLDVTVADGSPGQMTITICNKSSRLLEGAYPILCLYVDNEMAGWLYPNSNEERKRRIQLPPKREEVIHIDTKLLVFKPIGDDRPESAPDWQALKGHSWAIEASIHDFASEKPGLESSFLVYSNKYTHTCNGAR